MKPKKTSDFPGRMRTAFLFCSKKKIEKKSKLNALLPFHSRELELQLHDEHLEEE